jgi:hypothetical protein
VTGDDYDDESWYHPDDEDDVSAHCRAGLHDRCTSAWCQCPEPGCAHAPTAPTPVRDLPVRDGLT